MREQGRVVAILQARMSSTRLPGKVLKPILGRPMLALQLERLARCTRLDDLVVATSDRPDDDPVADLCASEGVPCFRGSLPDVLDRFTLCARKYCADHVVRLTGDCPLIDPAFVDLLVDFYFDQCVAYATYCRLPSLPDGLDAEIFAFSALEAAWNEGRDPFEREHVTPFIVRRPERFPAANWAYREDLSHLRWTVDEPEDFAFATRVYEELYPANPAFAMQDVLDLLARRPELAAINIMHKRKPGCEAKPAPAIK